MTTPLGFLRSHERFADRLVIGPGEDTLVPGDDAACTGLPLIGFYTDARCERVLFYRWNDALRLRIGADPPIPLNGCTAEWTATTIETHFRLYRFGAPIVERTYPLPEVFGTLEGDPTPFVEPEDFDLFLFVANVLGDHGRKARIFRAATPPE